MPSHYDDKPPRIPTRKPQAPIRGDAPTRGPNPDEMDDLEEKERIRKFLERLKADERRQIMVDAQKNKLPRLRNVAPSKLTEFVRKLDKKVEQAKGATEKGSRKLDEFVQELDEKVDARVEKLKEESPADLQKFVRKLDNRARKLQEKTKNKQAYGGLMKAKKMRGGGMAGKKPRIGNIASRKGGMVYSTKVKKG